ncbi:hypothetical protein HOR11_gp076 [Lactobacillus phage SA-C12]|uniref:Uncharacterized protein n=1 Tax=Lactobacillus phage SA-C12 TaxID=1755697 RepID=A0A1I9KKC3_9CAUD|nr:hypothetical protein HOR11_gp076 [Lactobacillus phage SA-C12]ALY06897.1 hypothetical protein SAC12_076 [Lactobacillus phage SA-C12]
MFQDLSLIRKNNIFSFRFLTFQHWQKYGNLCIQRHPHFQTSLTTVCCVLSSIDVSHVQ